MSSQFDVVFDPVLQGTATSKSRVRPDGRATEPLRDQISREWFVYIRNYDATALGIYTLSFQAQISSRILRSVLFSFEHCRENNSFTVFEPNCPHRARSWSV